MPGVLPLLCPHCLRLEPSPPESFWPVEVPDLEDGPGKEEEEEEEKPWTCLRSSRSLFAAAAAHCAAAAAAAADDDDASADSAVGSSRRGAREPCGHRPGSQPRHQHHQ